MYQSSIVVNLYRTYIMKKILIIIVLFAFTIWAGAQIVQSSKGQNDTPDKMRLYPKDTDTAQGYLLTFFASENSDKPARTAILVCPGGGYSHVAMNHEGIDVAKWLNQQGIDAYVLRYRVNTSSVLHHFPDQLNDVKEPMKQVRKRDYKKIGIMGFSAGGHLAGTYLTARCPKADFGILMYPVITTDSLYRHKGSFRALLGKEIGDVPPDRYSEEKQVTEKTPPVYLVHAKDDKVVPWQNSSLMYAAVSF